MSTTSAATAEADSEAAGERVPFTTEERLTVGFVVTVQIAVVITLVLSAVGRLA